MDDYKPIKVNRRRNKGMLWQVLALMAGAVVISLAIALVWQRTAGGEAQAEPLPSAVAQPPSEPEPPPPASSEPAPSSEAASEPETPEVPEGAVPEGERVKSPYFDDAVFVGDSITSGISLYQMMENTTVLADTGINLDTVYTREAVKQEDGTRIPIMDALAQRQYKKVYVMLGGNEVRGDTLDFFLTRYGKVLDDIKRIQPDALIYVQSMLPVTKNNRYSLDNARIDEFNEALIGLCKEKNVYYLNVAECMKNEEGMLPDEASPADGMHFGPDYYTKWFEYLKRHTVGAAPVEENEA